METMTPETMTPETNRALRACMTWAISILYSNAILIDTETTALGPEDEVAAVGLLSPSRRILMDQGFRPTAAFSAGATAVNGLTAETQADCPKWSVHHDELCERLDGGLAVAFNADFDRRLIEQTCARYGLTPPQPARWECAQKQAMTVLGGAKWVSLTKALHVWTGWPMRRCEQGAHGAIGDCGRLLDLLAAMAHFRGYNGREQLALWYRIMEHAAW